MTAPADAGQQDCQHVRVHHLHGTTGAYRYDSCRCVDCTASHLAERRTRIRAQTTGQWQPFTSARPVREHLEALRAAGVGVDRIAQLAGVPGSTVRLVIYGINGRPLVKLKSQTASRLLAARAREADRAARSTVESAQTRALLRDLLSAGIGWDDLAANLGRSTVSLRRSFDRPAVTIKTATDVARLHHELLTADVPIARSG